MKGYQHEVWNLINYFDSFNITTIPHSQNVVVDTLANTTSRFTPLNNGFTVEIIFRPFVPDNVTNWRVFNDDSQLIDFLTSTDIFQDFVIDDEVHQKNLQDYQDEENKIKANCIPRNVLSLENIFDLQSRFRTTMNPKMNNSTMMHALVNLGTPKQPNFINLGTCCSEVEKHTFTQFVQEVSRCIHMDLQRSENV
jgi:hypothetical protein